MKLNTAERKLLQAFASLASKLTGPSGKTAGTKSARGRRAGRSRADSGRLKRDILAAAKKGRPVAEISEEMGVTSPYVYQLMNKAGIKRRKSK